MVAGSFPYSNVTYVKVAALENDVVKQLVSHKIGGVEGLTQVVSHKIGVEGGWGGGGGDSDRSIFCHKPPTLTLSV